jgi:hypothetical protein
LVSLELLASRNQYESPLIMRSLPLVLSNVGDPDARAHTPAYPQLDVFLFPATTCGTNAALTVQLAAKYGLHTIEQNARVGALRLARNAPDVLGGFVVTALYPSWNWHTALLRIE